MAKKQTSKKNSYVPTKREQLLLTERKESASKKAETKKESE